MNNTSEWYAAENDMTNFYHVTARPEVRESYLNDFRQSADATTRAFGREREQIIREMDASTRRKPCLSLICGTNALIEKMAIAHDG